MKRKHLILSFFFLLISHFNLFAGAFSSSQIFDSDTVTLKNGRKMFVIVKEIKDEKLMYRKTEYANLLSLPLTDVKNINYQDGRKYTTPKPKVDTLASLEAQIRTKMQIERNQAKEDAQNTYVEGPIFASNLLLTFLFGGILGLIPAAIFSTTTPSDQKMGLKSGQSEEYNTAYREEVLKIRKKAIWNGFGIGLLLAGLLGLILYLQ